MRKTKFYDILIITSYMMLSVNSLLVYVVTRVRIFIGLSIGLFFLAFCQRSDYIRKNGIQEVAAAITLNIITLYALYRVSKDNVQCILFWIACIVEVVIYGAEIYAYRKK